MGVDWKALNPTLRAGEWTCTEHGRVEPRAGDVVPVCPDCGDMVLQVRIHTAGYPEFVEPAPSRCDGADHHPFGPMRVKIGWTGCECSPSTRHRGHRYWACVSCPSVIYWPPRS